MKQIAPPGGSPNIKVFGGFLGRGLRGAPFRRIQAEMFDKKQIQNVVRMGVRCVDDLDTSNLPTVVRFTRTHSNP